jgi:protoporphyrinogen oxidase
MLINSDKKCILIVGAGLTGLMIALRLRKLYPNIRIVVTEKSHRLGGMYQSFKYDDSVIFDYGMHIIYESCNPIIDNLYREIMPESEWHIYSDNHKDIAGLFFNGKLQTYSHYIDLRQLKSLTNDGLIESFFENLNNDNRHKPINAYEVLKNKFGENIVNQFHKPILERMYSTEITNLNGFAVKCTAFDRVIMFNENLMLELMKSDVLRSILAFPDQLKLPIIRSRDQKALYPKEFGMYKFINRLVDLLKKNRVEIITESDIANIGLNNNIIDSITVQSSSNNIKKFEISHLVWTAGWPSLAKSLNIKTNDLPFQKGPEVIFVNLLFDNPLQFDNLYYFYCYDAGFATFRVTNYSGYCPGAIQNNKFPICIELWPSKLGINSSTISASEAIDIAILELRKFGVLTENNKLFKGWAETKSSEFPLPSIKNSIALKTIKDRVSSLNLKNLTVCGVMAEDDLFFLPDILNSGFSKLNNLSI